MNFISIFLLVAILSTSTFGQNCRRTRLQASGASFPNPIYQQWVKMLRRNPRVTYSAVGSSAGIADFNAGDVDFAGTDSPLTVQELNRANGVQFPTVGGGVAIGHANNGCKNLRLTQRDACDIFLGGKQWSDFGCRCRRDAITVVVRSDGSGTTDVFTKSLSAFCSDFARRIGSGKEVDWPRGFVAREGNSGIAAELKRNRCAIGYVGFGTAQKEKLRVAAVENKAGNMVAPSAGSISAALRAIRLNAANAGSDPNPSGRQSYPISTFTYIIAKKRGKGAKAECIKKALTAFLSNKFQAKAKGLGFARLPGSVVTTAEAAVDMIA